MLYTVIKKIDNLRRGEICFTLVNKEAHQV